MYHFTYYHLFHLLSDHRGGRTHVTGTEFLRDKLSIMSLSYNQLDKLNKTDLIQYTLEVQQKYNENLQLNEKLERALSDIAAIQKSMDELRLQNTQLESTLAVTKNVNDQLIKRIESLERQANANSQYSRRECVEISGIPKTVTDENLENKVCEILCDIGVVVTGDRIEACHRLKNDRTIVKFASRKDCINTLKKRQNLKKVDKEKLGLGDDDKIYINESLCPEYRFLFWKCRLMAGVNKIYSFWTFNGTIKIKLSEEGRILPITHVKDLEKLFPETDFSKKAYE